MGYITYLHICEDCRHEQIELHDRSNVIETIECERKECSGKAHRTLYANVSTEKTSESRPSGTDKGSKTAGTRKDLKEMLNLRKEARRLKREGKLQESKAVKNESKRVGGK